MGNFSQVGLDKAFGALADPTRRAILARLEREDAVSVSELARPFSIKLPAVMKGWDEGASGFWHIGFMQVPGLAEKLVAGRQVDYLGYFFHFSKFTPGEQAHYLKAYGTPAQLHAAFEMYRASRQWGVQCSAKRALGLSEDRLFCNGPLLKASGVCIP